MTPPSWRPDLVQPADLVEEVLRLEGLEQIPSVLPQAPRGARAHRRAAPPPRGRPGPRVRRLRRGAAAGLPARRRVRHVGPRLPTTRGGAPPRCSTRSRPIVPNCATTLLPGLLEVAARNISRGQRDLAVFGIAQVVLPGPNTRAVPPLPVDRRPTDDEIGMLLESLPDQPLHVAVVLTGLRDPRGPWGSGRTVDAADAFAAADTIADASGVALERRPANYLPWHPGRCAELVVDGLVVGHAGELHPALLERAGLPPRTCAMELDLDAIPIRPNNPAPTVSVFPAVHQDVNVVVERVVPAASVESALRAGAGDLLEELHLFDVYEGAQVGEDHKSLTFALRFRATDRTLTEDEASAAREAAVAAAHEAVGAVLRR